MPPATPLDHPELGADPISEQLARTFRSARLVYRMPDPDDAAHLSMWLRVHGDADSLISGNPSMPKPPPTSADAREALKGRDSLLAVVICLDPDTEQPSALSAELQQHSADDISESYEKSTAATKKAAKSPIPIGQLSLDRRYGPTATQHRAAEIGIEMLRPYHGFGYGSEALAWTLDYAFDTAGQHSVSLGSFSWNTKALRAYERVGFRRCGIERETVWAAGRFWDEVRFSILEEEWRADRERVWRDVVRRKT